MLVSCRELLGLKLDAAHAAILTRVGSPSCTKPDNNSFIRNYKKIGITFEEFQYTFLSCLSSSWTILSVFLVIITQL